MIFGICVGLVVGTVFGVILGDAVAKDHYQSQINTLKDNEQYYIDRIEELNANIDLPFFHQELTDWEKLESFYPDSKDFDLMAIPIVCATGERIGLYNVNIDKCAVTFEDDRHFSVTKFKNDDLSLLLDYVIEEDKKLGQGNYLEDSVMGVPNG